mgnify:CR=1 FL=1
MKIYRGITTGLLAVIISAAAFLTAGTESRAYYYGNDKQMYDTFAEMEKVNRAQTAMENPDLRDVTLQAATIYTLTMEGSGELGGRISGSEAKTIMDIRERGMLVIGGCSDEALQLILSNGYMTEFIDEFQAWGYLNPNYVLPEIPVQDAPLASQDQVAGYIRYQKFGVTPCVTQTLLTRVDTLLKKDCLSQATDLRAVPAGTALTVLGMTDTGFYQVRLPDGTVGFIDAWATARPAP